MTDMCILKRFYPDERRDSAYNIDYEKLSDAGIKGLIFDIDNTLVPHGWPADERAIKLFERIHGCGMATALVSNNKEPRVKPFAQAVDSYYIFKADKPMKKGYQKAMEMMNTTAQTTVFIGDQLFTDVYGAKRCGIHSILTEPINPKEEIQIVLKRYLEKIVLYFYAKEIRKQNKR